VQAHSAAYRFATLTQRKALLRPLGAISFSKWVGCNPLENPMKLMNDLFFTGYGLMSIIGIAMMIGGGAIAFVVLRRKMRVDPPEGQKIRS
jgi:hypothetical protein